MERIFSDQHFQSLLLYLNDVIVFSSSFEPDSFSDGVVSFPGAWAKSEVEQVSLFQHEVSYLGHITSPQGVATDPGTHLCCGRTAATHEL